jgi:hypothetical protein
MIAIFYAYTKHMEAGEARPNDTLVVHDTAWQKYDSLIVRKVPVPYEVIVEVASKPEMLADTNYARLKEQYNALLQLYINKFAYNDTIRVGSYGYIALLDTVKENKIVYRRTRDNFNIPVVKDTKTITKYSPPTINLFVGGGIEAMNIAKTSNNDLNLKVYRTSDQKLTNHMRSHFGPIRYINKSPSSKNFVTASQDGTVKIYFIKDDDANRRQPTEQNIVEPKIFESFGSCSKYQLTGEINKLENLKWKPKPNQSNQSNQPIEKKWIPGMPKPVEKNMSGSNLKTNSITNSNYTNKKDSELYGVHTNNDYTNERLNEIKLQQEKKNSSVRVTNLPSDIQPRDLAELFDLYGRIADRDGIKIKNYDDTTMAFIKYVYPESAAKAIENLDYTAIDHYVIRVEYAKQR